MDQHLEKAGFFVGEQLSIADFALYAYTHVAPEHPGSAFRLDADRRRRGRG